MLNQYKIIIAILAFVFSFSLTAEAQDSAGAITTRASSQLVLWYDEDTIVARDSFLQITNTSPTTPVEVHIQIYSSDAATRCVEADFNDVLTMNDTHIYELNNIQLNQGEAGTPAPVPSVAGTKGFVVITPVVGAGDNTAISFQNMLGTVFVLEGIFGGSSQIAAAGRDAVDLTNGIIVPDGTPLDGVSTGYLQIRPDELTFNVTDIDAASAAFTNIDVISFVFNDQFGPAGLLGYRAVPGESTFSPFLFDFQEIPGSCPIITNTCFNNWGLNAQFPAYNQLTDPGVNICNAVTLGAQNDGTISGWARLFVNSISPAGNQFAVIDYVNPTLYSGAEWSHVVGPPIPIGPPVECQNLPAECGNPVCKPLPGCENPDASMGGSNFCADGIDNDGVNGTDCQDFGCDGFTAPSGMGPTGPCESAGETSCSDDFDNDLNGFIDCGGIEVVGETTQVAEPDPNCVAIGACGAVDTTTTSGSGGCSLAATGSETTGTTAANYLLALLPLAGVFALRRIRRRSSK